MDWHAAFIRTMIGPLWAKWEKSPYLAHYRSLLRTQYDSPEIIRARQWDKIQSLLHHAYATVPIYRERFDQTGLHPGRIQSPEDFQRLPILTKTDLRRHGPAMVSKQFDPKTLHVKKTSGSTGVAVEVHIDDAAMQWKRACTLRSDEWSGWRFGEPVAKIWGNPEYLARGWRGRLRNAVLDRATYLDTLKMDEDALRRFAEQLQRRLPALLFGHAHSIFLFAEFVRKAGRYRFQPKGIISTAMVLHAWQRRVIEDVFACRVTNRYGCEEVSLIACECEYHQGLHINSDGVFLELERDGVPAAPGEPGSILVTDLANRGMPIIRYKVGDVAVLSDARCPCGRGLPLLNRLEGREADYVVTPRGELISGISLTENFALQIPGIAQMQLIQEAVDRFVFRIVRGPDFGPVTVAGVQQKVRERFGPDVSFACEYVDEIPQEPSGKYRFCISRVPNPFTRSREEVFS
jgi:phenylacetate-CoA ligase